MPVLLLSGAGVGLPTGSHLLPGAEISDNSNPRVSGATNINTKEAFSDPWGLRTGQNLLDYNLSGAVVAAAGLVDAGGVFSSPDGDFRHRYYVIPARMTVTNPQLGHVVNFSVWNTYLVPADLQSVGLLGDIYGIDFDFVVGETIRDNQFLRVAATITDPIGEQSKFSFDNTVGAFDVFITFIAGDVFDMYPDIPIKESWEYLTEIIETWDSVEQRISYRADPRIEQTYTVSALEYDNRRLVWNTLDTDVKTSHPVRMFQYAVNPEQPSSVGTTIIYMDTLYAQVRVGQEVDIMNTSSSQTQTARIAAMTDTSITLNTNLLENVSTNHLIIPVFTGFMEDNPSFTVQSVTGDFKVTSKSLNPVNPVRTGANPDFPRLNGMYILNIRPLENADEQFYFRQQPLRNQIGKVALKSYIAETRNLGSRRFLVNTLSDQDPDALRWFIHEHKGAHKEFLLPTWLPDIVFTRQPIELATNISVERPIDLNNERMRRIMIEYNSGRFSYHAITANSVNAKGENLISISPQLPVLDEAEDVVRISYLMRVRGHDKIDIEHFGQHSIYSWSFMTVV